MKKNSITYSLTFLLVLGFGALMFERGFFWTREQNTIINDSDFYLALHHIMPIWIWGVLAMVFSAFIIAAPFFLPTQKLNNIFNYLICIGGWGNACFYFLMTSASVFHAINWLFPLQFSTFAIICGIMGFYGGVEIVSRRR